MIILFYTLLFLFIPVALILSFVILIQESKSMGLGAAFGSDAGSSVFGTSTADVLKKFTATLSAIFIALCLLLSFCSSSLDRKGAPTKMIESMEEGL